MLGQDSNRDPDEEEFIMVMLKTWEEGRAEAVLTVLRVRGIAISDALRERIVGQKDLEQLKRWHEKAIVATSIGEVIDDLS